MNIMDHVNSVKLILEQLTAPLWTDHPLATRGRKVAFDGASTDVQALTFQAFVNRINTFKIEHWGSDPNAAIYLSKYGFKTISGCKVQCVSCHIEIDMDVFLGKPDVLKTLAMKSHKQNCRWVRVSTPKQYFEIPRDPFQSLTDLKNTIVDLYVMDDELFIRKEHWIKMGLTEDFISAALNYCGLEYHESSATAMVLALCGWVKKDHLSIQCNFCQRVVGLWNFYTCRYLDTPRHASRRRKQSKVVSLLYSEIRRNMCDDTEMREIQTSEEAAVAPQSPPLETGEEHYFDESDHKPYDFVKAENPTNIYEKFGLNSSCPQAKSIKKKALRFLWGKSKRTRQRYHFKQLRLIMEKQGMVYWEPPENVDQRLLAEPVDKSKTEVCHGNTAYSEVSEYSVCGSIENNQVNECEKTNNGTNKDILYNTEPCNSEETGPPSSKLLLHASNTRSLENNKTESVGELEVQNNHKSVIVHAHSESSHPEEKCSMTHSGISNKCISSADCDTVMDVDDCDHGQHNYSNASDLSADKSCYSESCDAVNHDDPSDDSDGKRKCVPEHECNGDTQHKSELMPQLPVPIKPTHFTRSKKKELELKFNEQTKCTIYPSSGDGETVNTEQTAKEAEDGKNYYPPDVNDPGEASTCDEKNVQNNQLILPNHEQDYAEFTPVICSVVGNAVMHTDAVDDKTNSERVHDSEEGSSCDPVIVSAKSVCDEVIPQDCAEGGGEEERQSKHMENGYKADCQSLNASEYEPQKNAISECVTSKNEFAKTVNLSENSASNPSSHSAKTDQKADALSETSMPSTLSPTLSRDEKKKTLQKDLDDIGIFGECRELFEHFLLTNSFPGTDFVHSISESDSDVTLMTDEQIMQKLEAGLNAEGWGEKYDMMAHYMIKYTLHKKGMTIAKEKELKEGSSQKCEAETGCERKQSESINKMSRLQKCKKCNVNNPGCIRKQKTIDDNTSSSVDNSEDISGCKGDEVCDSNISSLPDNNVEISGCKGSDIGSNISRVPDNNVGTSGCKRKEREFDNNTSGLSESNVENVGCKRRKEDTDVNAVSSSENALETGGRCLEGNDGETVDQNGVSKPPNLQELELDRSYFHPEFEHRYWCIWRLQVADYLGICNEPRKGWEYHTESIKKGLELQGAEKPSFSQIDHKTLNCLAEIMAVTRQTRQRK